MKIKLILITITLLLPNLCRAYVNQTDTTSVEHSELGTIDQGFKCMFDGSIGAILSGGTVLSAGAIFGSQEYPTAFYGFGFEIAKYYNEITIQAPVFVYIRYNTTGTKNNFFADIKGGYTLNAGVFINPSIGIRIGNHKSGWILGIGYRKQAGMKGQDLSYSYSMSYPITVQSIDIKIGYEF